MEPDPILELLLRGPAADATRVANVPRPKDQAQLFPTEYPLQSAYQPNLGTRLTDISKKVRGGLGFVNPGADAANLVEAGNYWWVPIALLDPTETFRLSRHMGRSGIREGAVNWLAEGRALREARRGIRDERRLQEAFDLQDVAEETPTPRGWDIVEEVRGQRVQALAPPPQPTLTPAEIRELRKGIPKRGYEIQDEVNPIRTALIERVEKTAEEMHPAMTIEEFGELNKVNDVPIFSGWSDYSHNMRQTQRLAAGAMVETLHNDARAARDAAVQAFEDAINSGASSSTLTRLQEEARSATIQLFAVQRLAENSSRFPKPENLEAAQALIDRTMKKLSGGGG